MNNSFWLNNPNILFKSDQLSNIWPTSEMSYENKLNAITRLVLILTFIAYAFTRNIKVLLSGLMSLGAILLLYTMKNGKNKKEGFTDNQLYEVLRPSFTQPSPSNPVMNVLLPEIQSNPQRHPAANSFDTFIEKLINKDGADPKIFGDLGDNISYAQSMRNFYTNPSTTIPNSQKDFADFCYGNMASCKDADYLQCYKNNERYVKF